MNTAAKLSNRVLYNRLVNHLDESLHPIQAGFRRGRSTSEQLLALRLATEDFRTRQKTLVVIFVDYSKAFDHVSRNAIPIALASHGVPQSLIDVIMSMHIVKTSDGEAKSFNTSSGVLQGDTLASLLFIAVLDYILRRGIIPHTEDHYTARRRLSSRYPAIRVPGAAYADDTALFSDDVAKASSQLHRLESRSAEVGLSLNTAKTEAVIIGCDGEIKTSDGHPIKSVDDFVPRPSYRT